MYDQLNDELGWLTNPRSLWKGNITLHTHKLILLFSKQFRPFENSQDVSKIIGIYTVC